MILCRPRRLFGWRKNHCLVSLVGVGKCFFNTCMSTSGKEQVLLVIFFCMSHYGKLYVGINISMSPSGKL
jgi:hypothetical protein